MSANPIDVVEPPVRFAASENDHIVIRGCGIELGQLLNPSIVHDPKAIDGLRNELRDASPYPYLVVDGLFSEALLDLVSEEFSEVEGDLQNISGEGEVFSRSRKNPQLHSATQTYFDIIHSGHFVEFLSKVTGIEDLIVDCSLRAAGLHRTKPGGKFEIHCDFNFHRSNNLQNRFVVITYLNKDWKPEYDGDLEIWDAEKMLCARSIAPIFGRTVLIMHGDRSFHGHPRPLASPPDRSRRSLASYYYTNHEDDGTVTLRASSVHLRKLGKWPLKATNWNRAFVSMTWRGRARMLAQQITPPFMWLAARATSRSASAMIRRMRT
jgi:Rps23 Pro-64 3,4-dihydroxylase Tpa1-like proline 4-hydroxylase